MATNRNNRILKALAESMAAANRVRQERQRQEREKRGASTGCARRATAETLVNPHARQKAEYGEEWIADPAAQVTGRPQLVKAVRKLYPEVVDKWFAEGGAAFGEPQKRAIMLCCSLWRRAGVTGKLVANYGGTSGGGRGPGDINLDRMDAILSLGQLKGDIPDLHWSVFEDVVRFGKGVGEVGRIFATNPARQQAHVKNTVGMVASIIAGRQRL